MPRRAGPRVPVAAGGQLVGRDAGDGRAPPSTWSSPRPLGSETWPGCIRSSTAIGHDGARPLRRHAPAPAVDEAEPGGVGRADAQRTAPSRLRHAGSRMIVLAVNDRRSPADSTNGHSGSSPGGASVGQRRQLVEQLGDDQLDAPVGVPTRRHTSSDSSSVNTTPERAGEDGVEQPLGRPRGPRRSRPAARRRGCSSRSAARRPTAPPPPRRRRAASVRACGRARPAPARRAAGRRRSRRRRRRRTAAGPRARRRPQRRQLLVGRARRPPRRGGRGSPARAAARRAPAAPGWRRWNTLRGNSKLKNVASHFSNWVGAGST